MEIILGTGNQHKVFEVNEIAKDYGITFISPDGDFSPVENGRTFEENSIIKSKEASKLTNKISLADDSGLCIDALDGAPGLYSARYAGTQQEKISKILDELKSVSDRKAKFVCCMSLADAEGNIIHVTVGECHGQIIKEAKGINGFGYDPIFLPDGYNITLAEMSEDDKNLISHRGRALRQMLDYIIKNKDIFN